MGCLGNAIWFVFGDGKRLLDTAGFMVYNDYRYSRYTVL